MTKLIKIPEAASLALHSMAVLARRPTETLSTREIAKILDASETHLAKVMKRLEEAGLVKSSRGPKGGYTLRKPAHKVTLKEVYEAVQGPLSPGRCLLETPICGGEKCTFGEFIESLDRQFREHLAVTKLSDLALSKEVRHA